MARKGKNKVRDEDLSPGIAAGLTQGVPAEEALEAFPVRNVPTGVEVIRHMRDADQMLERSTGLPFARFVASSNASAVWSDGVTDRPQLDYTKTYTPDGMRLLREGRQCLRCDEPHPEAFPLSCDLCGYAMGERQIMDMAMEFEGPKHLGPRKPIGEYMEELELRTEKRKFIDRVQEGGKGRIPKEWLHDAVLFPSGPPQQVA